VVLDKIVHYTHIEMVKSENCDKNRILREELERFNNLVKGHEKILEAIGRL
jgi:hypothetical protein